MNQANIPLSAQGEMLAQLQAAAKEVTSYLHLAETESTNDVVRDMARRQVPEIAVVVADAQTRGRGRLGRRWISQPGTGLWVSLLVRPGTAHRISGTLSLAAALATKEAIGSLCGLTNLQLKWPNDVVADSGKLAGILVEGGGATALNWAAVGIGINVTKPPELAALNRPVVALNELSPTPVGRSQLLIRLVGAFGRFYRIFQEDPRKIVAEFSRHCATLGQEVTWQVRDQDGTSRRGQAVGIDDTGALLVRPQGTDRLTALTAAEISLGTLSDGAGRQE